MLFRWAVAAEESAGSGSGKYLVDGVREERAGEKFTNLSGKDDSNNNIEAIPFHPSNPISSHRTMCGLCRLAVEIEAGGKQEWRYP